MLFLFLLLALLPCAVYGAPAAGTGSQAMCGQWDTAVSDTYTIYQDMWGKGSATSGSQCTTVGANRAGALAWSTSWSWLGASSSVKSYANVVVKQTTGIKLSAITSIPTTWHWSYTGSNIVADVSYDMFTSASPKGSNAYEIMVWLGALGGAGPISSNGRPVATPSIGGVSWKLFKGPNGSTTVFSFVSASQQDTFSGDLKALLQYLITNEGLSSNQYLISIGAGTEPFTGSNAVLTTSTYRTVINQK